MADPNPANTKLVKAKPASPVREPFRPAVTRYAKKLDESETVWIEQSQAEEDDEYY